MKLSLRQKSRLTTGMFVAALPLCGVAIMFNDRVFMLPAVAAIGLMLASLALQLKWWRCPHCHTSLMRNVSPKFCPHCGVEIDYDAT